MKERKGNKKQESVHRHKLIVNGPWLRRGPRRLKRPVDLQLFNSLFVLQPPVPLLILTFRGDFVPCFASNGYDHTM